MHPVKTVQPGHPPSLIRVFAVGMKKAWALNFSAQEDATQSSFDALLVAIELKHLHAVSKDSDQIAQMCRLIRVLTLLACLYRFWYAITQVQ